MNPVVHFELPAEDKKRMVKFYSEVFGWQANELGPEFGNYVVVMTSESDKKGPLKRGIINGGFFEKTEGKSHPTVVIAVPNIREAIKKVEEKGGKIIGGQRAGEPDDIPGVGKYISFIDTEGNQIALLQPIEM